jgi:hypothetical protein
MWEGVSPYAQPVVPGIFRELAQQEHNKARRLQVRPHAHPFCDKHVTFMCGEPPTRRTATMHTLCSV